MTLQERLATLAASAGDDRETATPAPGRDASPMGITHVRLPGGGTTPLMRVMLTNACSLACGYCATWCGRRMKRTSVSPEELARGFMALHRKGLAQGLFVTSGVPGRPVKAMDRLLAAAELLREREGYRGYLHLKLLPGAEPGQVERAAQLADRLSVNLEAPTDGHLQRLAPEKRLAEDLLPKLLQAGALWRQGRLEPRLGRLVPAGTTTQFVVGGAGEPDREILSLVARLEREGLLHHAHFSAFQPVADTPMEGAPATPMTRELRLYQAEHLLRQYGFALGELPFDPDGNLPLDRDPKLAWALRHPERFPIEVLTADLGQLLRVPGIGPAAARRILQERRRVVLRGLADLRWLGVQTARAAGFLTLCGRRLGAGQPPVQLGLDLPRAPLQTLTPPCAYR